MPPLWSYRSSGSARGPGRRVPPRKPPSRERSPRERRVPRGLAAPQRAVSSHPLHLDPEVGILRVVDRHVEGLPRAFSGSAAVYTQGGSPVEPRRTAVTRGGEVLGAYISSGFADADERVVEISSRIEVVASYLAAGAPGAHAVLADVATPHLLRAALDPAHRIQDVGSSAKVGPVVHARRGVPLDVLRALEILLLVGHEGSIEVLGAVGRMGPAVPRRQEALGPAFVPDRETASAGGQCASPVHGVLEGAQSIHPH